MLLFFTLKQSLCFVKINQGSQSVMFVFQVNLLSSSVGSFQIRGHVNVIALVNDLGERVPQCWVIVSKTNLADYYC